MNEFLKYQHIERYGTDEVDGIEYGDCFVFPKIDGTNSQLWWNDGLKAGSRNRELTIHKDNAGFYNWALEQENIERFFNSHPHYRLYGEWLVPHSLKTYREDAWRRFYVFDVLNAEGKYLSYEEYKPILEEFSIDYIVPLRKITNPTEDRLYQYLNDNDFLIEDGKGIGEGIVIKRYDYVNKYGRTTWAKIVTSEFKEKHKKELGLAETKEKTTIEDRIIEQYQTTAMIDKVKANIENFSSKDILRLINTVYYDLIREESWDFIKEFKNPIIDYKRLMNLSYQKTKHIVFGGRE